MLHKNTVKTRRAKENSAILEETQSQCTVGRRSLLLCPVMIKLMENNLIIERTNFAGLSALPYIEVLLYMVRLRAVLFSQSSQGSAGLERAKWPRVYGCPGGGTYGMFNKPKKNR